jgi:RNA polymerase sigma-70 factor (ECF subfamily)
VAARRGEGSALTELYRELHPRLLRYLHARVRADAEDLAADVWIEAARALPTFEDDEKGFRRLLFTIARRRAIDHGRRERRRRTDPVDPATLATSGVASSADALVLERLDAYEAVERIAALLPPDQAEVVVLRVVAGLSVHEVAEIVGRRAAAVSVLQHRALRRLARKLGAEEGRTL